MTTAFVTRRAALRAGGAGAGAALLAACAGLPGPASPGDAKPPSTEPVDLTMTVRADRAGLHVLKLWEDVAAEFKKHRPRISVRLEEYPSGEYNAKITALTAAGSQPDALELSDEPFFEFAHQGFFLDLGPYVARDRRELNPDDFFPGVLDFWRWDPAAKVPGTGKLFGLPRSSGAQLFLYNKQVFQEAGVPEPPADGSWTWDEWLQRARRLTKREGDTLTRAALPQMNALRDCLHWLVADGAPNTADVAKRQSTVNTPLSIEVLRRVADYRLKDRIQPTAADQRNFGGDALQHLATGKFAMATNIGYLYQIRQAFRETPDNWDVALLPKGRKAPSVRGAWSPFAPGAQTRFPAETWEFMKYGTSAEGQTYLGQQGFLPSVRKSVAQKILGDPKTPQNEQRWIEAKKHEVFEPLNDVYQAVRQVQDFYWRQILDDQKPRPVAEAARLTDEYVNKIYQGGAVPADWEGLPKS